LNTELIEKEGWVIIQFALFNFVDIFTASN